MTTLTNFGLILLAPQNEPHTYLLQLQEQNYNVFLKNSSNAYHNLGWLNFEEEEGYE